MVGERERGAVGGRNLNQKSFVSLATGAGETHAQYTLYPQKTENLVVAQLVHTHYFCFHPFNHMYFVIYERSPAAMSESIWVRV
jgi:hypothetical protein